MHTHILNEYSGIRAEARKSSLVTIRKSRHMIAHVCAVIYSPNPQYCIRRTIYVRAIAPLHSPPYSRFSSSSFFAAFFILSTPLDPSSCGVFIQLFARYSATMTEPVVETSCGPVRGVVDRTCEGLEYCAFKGIPYAEPPIGELRFQVSWREESPHT